MLCNDTSVEWVNVRCQITVITLAAMNFYNPVFTYFVYWIFQPFCIWQCVVWRIRTNFFWSLLPLSSGWCYFANTGVKTWNIYCRFLMTALLFKITRPSLFAVSQIRGGRPKNKNTWLDPSAQKNIKIFRRPKQLLEPSGVRFKEMKENTSSSHHSVSAQNRKTINITKTLFLEGRSCKLKNIYIYIYWRQRWRVALYFSFISQYNKLFT